MKITKKKLSSFASPYSICSANVKGETVLFAGSEVINGELIVCSGKELTPRTLAKGPGGYMGLIPLESFDFPAIAVAEGLHTNFQSVNAGISIYSAGKDARNLWNRHRIADLAYIHRIALVSANGKKTIIAASLCGRKEGPDDWSSPGAVYAVQIQRGEHVTKHKKNLLLNGITRNHGMYVQRKRGQEIVFISGDEGVFEIHVPRAEKEWIIDKIIEQPVSELALMDFDEDGKDEIVTIQPFHGDKACIYKNMAGKWETVCELKTEFGHGIWAGRIGGKNAFILGSRARKRDLCLYTIEDTRSWNLKKTIIEAGTGTAQIDVLKFNGRDLIAATNGYIDEVAVYEVTN